MAGFPVQMPGLDSLVQTFGVYNPETYQKARQSYDLSSAYNQQNLVDQQQAYQQRERMNPLDVQAKQLGNEGSQYSNEATRLGNAKLSRQNEIDAGVPIDMERQYRISDFARKLSDNDMKQLENQIQTDALSTDPQRRQRGLSQMQFFKDVVAERTKAREQHGYKMEEIGAQGANSERVARIGADSRESVAAARGAAKAKDTAGFLQILQEKYKRPDEKYGALLAEAKRIELENPGDPQAIAQASTLRAMAAEIKNLAQVRAGSTPKAGTPDLDALNIRTNPTADIGPSSDAKPQAAPAGVPQVGEVRKGFKFKGGHPGDKNNWIKVN